MPCEWIKGEVRGEPFTAIACSRRPLARRRCSNCGELGADLLCDQPDARHKSGTCDRPLCGDCAISLGPDVDVCPSHRREIQGSLFAE